MSAPPLAIVHAFLGRPHHGVTTGTLAVVRHLRRLGFDIVTFDRATPSRLRRCLQAPAQLAGVLRAARHRPAVTYYRSLSGDGGLWIDLATVAALRMLRPSMRIVVHHHSYAYVLRRRLPMRLLLHRRLALHHVVLHARMGVELSRRYGAAIPARHCHVVDNLGLAAPHEGGRGAEPDRSAAVTLGMLSNHSRSKGTITLLEQFRELRAQGHDVRLALGGPLDDDVRRWLRQHATVDVEAPGTFVDGRAGTSAFYDAVDLFVFPTTYHNEAQPFVVLEAKLAGCIVLAHDRGVIAHQLDPGDGDVATTPDTLPAVLAAAVQHLVELPADDRRVARSARQQRNERRRRCAEAAASTAIAQAFAHAVPVRPPHGVG